MIKLKVNLSGRSYPVHAGAGAFEKALAEFSKLAALGRKTFCIADRAVLKAHPGKAAVLAKTAKIIEVAGGEKSKSIKNFAALCSALARENADRKSAVAALGGGVVGDLAGFVSASYMRGTDFYQIPTTLLAMVDSSVGGKTGVNIAEGKNLVGAFHQPKAVFTDTDFLSTLPARQFAAGMAEVAKCAVLGDAKLFAALSREGEKIKNSPRELSRAIAAACSLKAKIVAADELETAASGGRALLNLGHTFGHAIERCAGYGKYLHGEAVAVGMVMAAVLSRGLGLISGAEVLKIESLLKSLNLPVRLRPQIPARDLMEAMSRDKKAVSGQLRFVVIESIGSAATMKIDRKTAASAIADFYKS